MAQGVPDASFADGCKAMSGATSVGGFVSDFLKFLASPDGANGCQVTDKLYSFAADAFGDFDINNTFLQIAESPFNPLSHSIKLSNVGGFQPGTFDFNYNVSATVPGLYIKHWFASAEPVAPAPISDYTLTIDTDFSGNAAVVFPGPSITPIVPLLDEPTSVAFTNQLVVTPLKAGPNGFTNTIEQATFRDPSEVPGPLPLLGAAAAFGFSRKLRARIKTMA